MNLDSFERLAFAKIENIASTEDPAHDLAHFRRVVATAKRLARETGARMDVVVPAAWLHDLIVVPKNDPRRAHASRLSAEAAVDWLREIGYPADLYAPIAHAVHAHSFSANVPTESLEAAVVQDADRLDGLGAIGVARCFATAGLMKRVFYADDDPFCDARTPDDGRYTIDHFYRKLFATVETLKTAAGRAEGERRARVMRGFLDHLRREVTSDPDDANVVE